MTHNERVLDLLSDGQPHSHHELYGLHVIAHSRVSDLRKQGYTIEQWREGDLYLYRLLNPGDGRVDAAVSWDEQVDAGGTAAASARSQHSAPGGRPPTDPSRLVGDAGLAHGPGVLGAEVLEGQLSIEDVAA